ncbi:SDR family oxidoreductase [Colwellia sp. MEBiC06753]
MSKNIVITGANRGIGLAMAVQLVKAGNKVYAVCRKSSEALSALAEQSSSALTEITGVDVTDEAGLNKMKAELAGIAIDCLVCNAGILRDENLNDFNLASIREQFEVNALAPLRVVHALDSQLISGSKIAMITSRMGSIADNGSGGRFGYRMSKAALNAASVSLSIDLAPRNIAVGIYHPGYVQTDMVGGRGDISAAEAASRLLGLIEHLTLEQSGEFRHSNGEVLPW